MFLLAWKLLTQEEEEVTTAADAMEDVGLLGKERGMTHDRNTHGG